MKPVLIIWRDASTEAHMNWEPRDVAPLEDTLVYTVGFVKYEDDLNIELVMSYHKDEVAGRWTIPKVCITEIKEIQ